MLRSKTLNNAKVITFKCLKNPFNSSYKFIIMKDGKLISKGAGE